MSLGNLTGPTRTGTGCSFSCGSGPRKMIGMRWRLGGNGRPTNTSPQATGANARMADWKFVQPVCKLGSCTHRPWSASRCLSDQRAGGVSSVWFCPSVPVHENNFFMVNSNHARDRSSTVPWYSRATVPWDRTMLS